MIKLRLLLCIYYNYVVSLFAEGGRESLSGGGGGGEK